MSNSGETVRYVTVEKAAELLDKSGHSVRQLLFRKKLKSYRQGGKLALLLSDVMSYQAKKKGLPAWEEHYSEVKDKPFIGLANAAATLSVQPIYLIKLIKQQVIEGYVCADGTVLVSTISVNQYLKSFDNDKSSTAGL